MPPETDTTPSVAQPPGPRPWQQARPGLVADLLAFVRGAGPAPLTPDPSRAAARDAAFDGLAARVLAYQAAAVPAYGRLVEAQGGLPFASEGVRGGWRHAPLVPTELFRDVDLSAQGLGPSRAVFRTSGTTGHAGHHNGAVGAVGRGTRRVPELTLYDAAMEAPFVQAVLGGPAGSAAAAARSAHVHNTRVYNQWLSLIPSADTLPDSSLSHMVTTLAHRLAAETTWATGREGLDADLAWGALEAAARAGQPVVFLATSFALVQLLDAAPTRRARLPAGSRAMLTGGFKGRTRTVEPAELLALAADRLGLEPDRVADEYGMTELTSQAYAARVGEPLASPPWLRLRVVDPDTLEDLAPGREGLVAFFDLLNLDNVSAILTSDLGVLDAAGRLTLHGRAPGAPARGCSLTAEELGVR